MLSRDILFIKKIVSLDLSQCGNFSPIIYLGMRKYNPLKGGKYVLLSM